MRKENTDNTGYFKKYDVKRIDGKPVGRTFTIEIDKDPLAAELLRAIAVIYSRTRPELSKDLFSISDNLFDARNYDVKQDEKQN